MMNLSCHKMMTSGAGDTLTITCFTCGMPSSKEWAQKISSRPLMMMPPRPFFPFLVTIQPPVGAVLKEDGTTFVCAFCHASLEAQWRNYERQPGSVPPANRKYILYKFICAVCGVETYRKRVRTLPFQEFPFLTNQRPAGSLTLGNNPLAVVCLDCSETLWAQSAEYDRWGLPIHKRRFNWLARPPPDPDSLEATVARLPSGETQLPRCPPTEPVLKPKEPLAASVVHFEASSTPVKVKVRNSKSDSNNSTGSDNEIPNTGRKTSLALLEQCSSSGGVHPPVVTVAPMSSSHSASLTAHRKDSLPAGYGSSLIPCGHPMFPRTTVFPPTSYGPYPWTLENSSDHYSTPYDPPTLPQHQSSSSNASWPWIPPASGLIPYSNYIPTPYTSSRSYSVSEPFYNNSNSYNYPPSPESTTTTVTTSAVSSTSYLTPLRPSSPRGQRPGSPRGQRPSSPSGQRPSSPSGRRPASPRGQRPASPRGQRPASPRGQRPASPRGQRPSSPRGQRSSRNVLTCNREGNSPPPPAVIPRKLSAPEVRQVQRQRQQEVMPPKKLFNKNEKSPPPLSHRSSSATVLPKKSYLNSNVEAGASSTFISVITEHSPSSSTFKPKANAIRNHNNEKLMIAKKWKKVAMAEAAAASAANKTPNLTTSQDIDEGPPPCKIGRSCAESEPVDFSVKERTSGSSSSLPSWSAEIVEDCNEDDDDNNDNDVIDLSRKGTNDLGRTSNKFMIAYLCQSEQEVMNGNLEEDSTDKVTSLDASPVEPSGRRSVIVTLPKVSDRVEDEDKQGDEQGSDQAELIQVSSVESSTAELEQDIEQEAWNSSPKNDQGEDCDKAAGQKAAGPMKKCSNENGPEAGDGKRVKGNGAQVGSEVSQNGAQVTQNPSQVAQNGAQVTQNPSQMTKIKAKCKDADDDLNKVEAEVIQDYVQKAVGEYKDAAKQADLLKKKFEANQEEFLGLLGLVTLQKKSEVELNKLISRSKHYTLPPLKLRPSTPPKVELDEEFESKLREIAFDDPSLKKCDLINDEDEVTFLAQIGLQPASKSEKEKRETKWRIVLTERMMRAKRGENLTGGKKPWESEESVSKLLSNSSSASPKSTSSQLGVLSVALPTNEPAGAGSADLLQIVTSSSTTSAINSALQPVITYPKYIPSYATRAKSLARLSSKSATTTTTEEDLKIQREEDTRILKVPLLNHTSLPGSLANSLKVNLNDEGSSEKGALVPAGAAGASGAPVESSKDRCRPSLDEIIRADTLNCENFVNQINNLLASGSNGDDQDWPSSAAEWRQLKKYLKARQSQMKMMGDKVKKREKVVLSRLRASMSSNTH